MSPLPPPYMGPSIATAELMASEFAQEYDVCFIDTRDPRPLDTLGKVDVGNVAIALKHYVQLMHRLLGSRAELVYLLVSQTRIGFLRDVPFIIMSKLFGKKVVLHLRGGYFGEFYRSCGPIMRAVIRRILQRIDRMIVLGESLKASFCGLVIPGRISVVPNGLDIPKPVASKPETENVRIVFLGNMIETKGYEEVLRACQLLHGLNLNADYVLAGSWISEEKRRHWTAFLEEQGLGARVRFVGAIKGKEKMQLLYSADIFVFPTYYPPEGHPWVIVEAMGAGLPIITTNQGCIAESVINEDNGFIIPKRDPVALAEKMQYLIKNRDARKRMGRRSRELYEAKFTKAHFIGGMINAIQTTLEWDKQ